ncbi:hypothetical protein H1C71_003710 [Ictidomys tridecemlineatus]|nr:hypothetical protein H1C71_003710 [Ictidomys tridecemlineatus]
MGCSSLATTCNTCFESGQVKGETEGDPGATKGAQRLWVCAVPSCPPGGVGMKPLKDTHLPGGEGAAAVPAMESARSGSRQLGTQDGTLCPPSHSFLLSASQGLEQN